MKRIRTKVQEMEQCEWRVEFRWIKAHAVYRGVLHKNTNECSDE